MSFDLRGRVAVVTGGGRGLGRAIARGLASHGASLALCGRDLDTLERTAAEIGPTTLACSANVAEEADVQSLFNAVLDRFGRVDILVNNAGINPIYKSIERTTLTEWQQILGVNLTGAFLCTKLFGTHMAEAGGGSIINVSSVAGHVGLRRSVPYCATKGGLELMTRAAALDWAPRLVRVNCIAPGYFETDLTAGLVANPTLSAGVLAQTPLGRFGRDSDIVGAAVFLASPASAYVTGQSLVVDGGYLAA